MSSPVSPRGGAGAGFGPSSATVAGVTVREEITANGATAAVANADRVKAKRLQCYDCGREGFSGYSIRAEDITVSGCGGAGVDAFTGRVTLKRASITGNGHTPIPGSGSGGVIGTKLSLIDVVATGNQAGPLLAPAGTPMDVFAAKKPRLRNSTCEHSGTMGNYDTAWGVCSAD